MSEPIKMVRCLEGIGLSHLSRGEQAEARFHDWSWLDLTSVSKSGVWERNLSYLERKKKRAEIEEARLMAAAEVRRKDFLYFFHSTTNR